MCFFWLFFLGNEARPNEIDSEISQTVRNLDKISTTKNVFDGRVETTLTAEKKNTIKANMANVRKKYGYFSQQPCDFSKEKDNLPENSIFFT